MTGVSREEIMVYFLILLVYSAMSKGKKPQGTFYYRKFLVYGINYLAISYSLFTLSQLITFQMASR